MRLDFPLYHLPLFFSGEIQANIRIIFRGIKIVVYHETDIPEEMSSFSCFQKVSLHVNVRNMKFQEAVPWGNMICSELKDLNWKRNYIQAKQV